MNRVKSLIITALLSVLTLNASTYNLNSPDGKIQTTVSNDKDGLTFSVAYDNEIVINPSPIGLTLADGTVGGVGCKLSGAKRSSVDKMIKSPLYRKSEVRDHYNELSLNINKDWSIVFRAYDDAVAYRFVKRDNNPDIVVDEMAIYRLNYNGQVAVPYTVGSSVDNYEDQFFNSFENIYTVGSLTNIDNRRLIFLPLVAEGSPGKKILFSEVNLLDYPGMYLANPTNGTELRAVFAPYPKEVEQGGYNNLQGVVKSHEDFIAKLDGARALPWRVMVFADEDKNLAASDITYLLAEPSRVEDTSWIKPGKVAWDWWNAWNLEGVDFETGINNDTYKAYIDFASKHGIEYIILDEGWAVNKKADLRQIVPEIDLKELVDYGAERNVGLILWAGYKAFENNMEENCKYFADLGIKGFKIDFMNRDDQLMTEFYRKAAETTAKNHQVIDFHGAYKPAGFTSTYPNVLNHEGVHGLETCKWNPETVDMVEYDVMIPFIRQVAGPMDYTQGAMHNASKGNFRAIHSEPMSQGTRCRQLALYMVLDSPLNMLCDSPSNYDRESECTEFISSVPTVWDETIVLDGKMGDYIVTARRSGDRWFIGGLTDWTPRDLEVDLSFLPAGKTFNADIFTDGVNAHRKGVDYKRNQQTVDSSTKLKLHLAPGGGFAAVIE